MDASFTKHLTAHDFLPHLQIPTKFLRKNAENLSPNVFVVNEDGESRIVKIEKIKNDHFFTFGWKKIAQELELHAGELLLFKLVDKSTFHLAVYESNGCDKTLNSSDDEQKICSSDDDEEQDSKKGKNKEVEMSSGSRNDKNWIVKLTKDHESELELPNYLANDSGLRAFKKLDLVGDEGRKLGRVNISCKRGKFSLTGGWNEFLLQNEVVVGSTVSLDFVECSRDIIKFGVVKSKSSGKLFCIVVRGRGRPAILK